MKTETCSDARGGSSFVISSLDCEQYVLIYSWGEYKTSITTALHSKRFSGYDRIFEHYKEQR